MAIVNYQDEPQKKPQEIKPLIEPKDFKSNILDTRYIPKSSIITQIDGAPWKVNFYSQVVNDDNALQGHSPGKDRLTQQYVKTIDMILKVTSPLTTSQDDRSNSMIVSGSANTYPSLKPNQGDMFIADIGEGRTGIFRVTSVEEKSIFKETTSSIDYLLVSYADGTLSDKRVQDLELKVIKEQYFVRDFMLYNQNPFLATDEYNLLEYISKQYHLVVDNYFRMFTSHRLKSILIPNQKQITYDSFLATFLSKAFDGSDTDNAIYFTLFKLNEDRVMELPTIWNVLLERNPSLLSYCTTKVGIVDTSRFTHDPMLEGVKYVGIDYIVYPINPVVDIDTEYLLDSKVSNNTNLVSLSINGSTDEKSIGLFNNTVLIKRINQCTYYVLSKDFYLNTDNQSVLEGQVWKYLRNEPVDIRAIDALVKDYHNWGRVEKFYYIPILLVLMKSIIRGI